MSLPTPALVTQRAAQRLPRMALLLFCAAWVIPGLVGRDPWRNADVTAFGVMSAMAEGRTSWWSPTLGGVPFEGALLPHWLGAWAIRLLAPVLDPALAARLPFAALLVLTLACVWYATFHWARSARALPVAFAFGGEAHPVDYARALADGALLAFIASLGLLQLGHETTPETLQLAATGLWLWGLASTWTRPLRARGMAVAALVLLSASGAPAMACLMGGLVALACRASHDATLRRFAFWPLLGALSAALLATGLGSWAWRLHWRFELLQLQQLANLWAWFLWPVWPLVLWTSWQWRRQLADAHVALPWVTVGVGLAASGWMGSSDRALLLALPGASVLAAFALPTLKRGAAAAIDWFSMCFFSGVALFVWAMYIAIQVGSPKIWAENVQRLAAGFTTTFSALEFGAGVLATVAWLALVRWRTGRHQHALWKSLVIPAGGVALCWLLLMTLWLPLLDFARSSRPGIDLVRPLLGDTACVAAEGFSQAMVASWETMVRIDVDAKQDARSSGRCSTMVRVVRGEASSEIAQAGWQLVGSAVRPTDRTERVFVYRREAR